MLEGKSSSPCEANPNGLFTEVRRRCEPVEKVAIGRIDSPELGWKRLRMGVFDVKPRTRIGAKEFFNTLVQSRKPKL